MNIFRDGEQVQNATDLKGVPIDSLAGILEPHVLAYDAASGKFIKGDAQAVHVHVRARKGSPGTINAGEVVYISGWNPSGFVELELADASNAAKMPAVGVAEAAIGVGSDGFVIVAGVMVGIDTSTPVWSVGDDLYVSATPGTLTSTKPTGTNLVQRMGQVLRVHSSQGTISVAGAGRVNDLPNLAQDKVWQGDGSGVPQEVDLDTEVAASPDVASNTTHRGVVTGNPHDVTLEQARTENNQLAGDIDANGNEVTGLPATPSVGSAAGSKDYIDSLVQGLAWQEPVEGLQTTPPGSPGTGDRYIVEPTGTGLWSGQDNDIATWNGSSWDFDTPTEGWACRVLDDDNQRVFNGSTWVTFGSTITHNNTSGIQGGGSTERYHLTATEHGNVQGNGDLSNVENLKVNLIATSDPGTGNDNTQGYAVGSRWVNVSTDKEFVCLDATTSAAVWTETTANGGPGSDTTAVHVNAAGEIAAIAQKTSATKNDEVIIEDTTAGNAKKSMRIKDMESAFSAMDLVHSFIPGVVDLGLIERPGSNPDILFTDAHDATNKHNYHRGVSSNATAQTSSRNFLFRLPSNFGGGAASFAANAIKIFNRVAAAPGTSGLTIKVYETNDHVTPHFTTSKLQNTSWTETQISTTDLSGGSFGAGGIMKIEFVFESQNSKAVDLGEMKIELVR